MSDGGSTGSGGASSGGSTGVVGDGGRIASGGVSGSTLSGGAGSGPGSGGVQAVATGGHPSTDAGSDAGAPATGGKPATGGRPATGGAAATPDSGTVLPTIPMNGMMLWLRADKGVTSSNGVVSRWADQTASHLDAVQATARTQPELLPDGINGHPAIVFDGVDDFLQITKAFDVETGAVTVFGVALVPDSNICSAIFESSNGAEDNDISLGPNMQKVNWEILDTADENTAFDQGTPVIVSGSVDTDGTGFVVTNGVVGSTLSNYDVPAMLQRLQTFIGKSLYAGCQTFAGRIGEVIIYNRALSLEETLAVQKYLGDEFGCCVN